MEVPSSSFKTSSLIRHRPSIDMHQASFHESIKVNRRKYSKRQLLTIFSYIYGNFFLAACVSLQAPFFPREAESKGATSTEYGFVFGAYEIAIIAVSPIVGKLVAKTSPRILIQFGLILTGCATIAFGYIDRLPDGRPFIMMAFVVRILEGIGAAAFTTPSYAATADEFPQDQATILSLLETSFGLGLIFGPTMGGWMYEVGGYVLPFLAVGMCLLLGAVLNFTATFNKHLPTQEEYNQINAANDEKNNRPVRYLDILLTPGVLLYALSIVTCLTFIGFNAATLEPHLRQFELSIVAVGAVFVINGTIYALTAPFGGWLCNKYSTHWLLVVGIIVSLVGLVFIGPLPITGLETKLPFVIGALVATGFGGSIKLLAALVGTFKYSVNEVKMPDNKATFGVCSSIYHTATSIGALIGPSMGGWMLDTFGYQSSTYFLVSLEATLLALALWFSASVWRK